jgi:hypothetical protein
MDYNQVGVPFNYQRVVSSGAGGNTTVEVVVPAGQIWFVKFITAYHSDGAASRVLVYYLDDAIAPAVNIQLPGGASVAANIRNDYPLGTYHKGPLVLSPGGVNIRLVAQALAAATNAIIELHAHKILGAWPIV